MSVLIASAALATLMGTACCDNAERGEAEGMRGVASAEAKTRAETRSSTSARPSEVLLHWSAPSSCPQHGEVAKAIEEHLGLKVRDLNAVSVRPAAGQPAGEAAAHPETGVERSGPVIFHADGNLKRANGRFRVVLAFTRDGVRGERVLEHGDCQQLGAAAAFVIAVAADPGLLASVEPKPNSGAKDPAVSARELQPPPATDEGVQPDPRRRRTSLAGAFRVSGGANAGILPGFGPGVRALGALRFRGWRLEGGVGHWFPQKVTTRQPVDGQALHISGEIQLTTGFSAYCYEIHTKTGIEFPICAGVEFGVSRASAVSASSAQGKFESGSVRLFWGAADLGLGLSVPLAGPLAVVARAEGVFSWTNHRFEEETSGLRLWTLGVVGLRVLAGLELRFGGDLP